MDGGLNDQILTPLERYLLPWNREIKLLVLTYPQADHLTGVLHVLERYKVKQIFYYPSVYGAKDYEKFLEAIKNDGAWVLLAAVSDYFQVGELHLQIV